MHKPHIDAGHGGADPGAVGLIEEEDVALAIALKVNAACKRQGWSPSMSRTSDKGVELGRRSQMANARGADVFVSIHLDWSGARGNGFAEIVPTTHDVYSSRRLATFINSELTPITATSDVGVYADRRGLSVMRGTDMPATLIEVCSVADKFVKDPAFQNRVAEEIVQGMCRFYGVAYVAPGKAKPANPAKPVVHPKLPVLTVGTKGHYVTVVQKVVGAKADGIFGPNTKSHVIAFQKKHGLVADGIVGPKTWAVVLAH